MSGSLTFKAVSEALPGPKWKARWDWSWPAYQGWFSTRSDLAAPSRAECEEALAQHMPELVPVYDHLCRVAGADDEAARFLSGWCPPSYLGGCSIAAKADATDVRLVRNYDLSPDLNEGFLLRSEWNGQAVMGMIEFLWGLSDGINDRGLCVALAFGGRSTTGPGFGITHIVRYVLETCGTVGDALETLRRIPSHMAYNLVLAGADRLVVSVEMQPGGGLRLSEKPVATNHQGVSASAERPEFTRTVERKNHLEKLVMADDPPTQLRNHFLAEPLFQTRYEEGFGTLFTIDYDLSNKAMLVLWPGQVWEQSLDQFAEGSRSIQYHSDSAILPSPNMAVPFLDGSWPVDAEGWIAFGYRAAECYRAYTAGRASRLEA